MRIPETLALTKKLVKEISQDEMKELEPSCLGKGVVCKNAGIP